MRRTAREIGSEFWDIPVTDQKCSVWPDHIQWYRSGRSALHAIIKAMEGVHSAAMPSWCCHTMIQPFTDAGIRVCFYRVCYENGKLIQELNRKCDALFLMDYFGYTHCAHDISGYSGVVIRDVTHSVFSAEYADADYYYGSLRKWCGVRTGGYAWTGNGGALPVEDCDGSDYASLRETAMELKKSYINGDAGRSGERAADKRYLQIFSQAEERLDHCKAAPAEPRDVELAEKLDLDYIKNHRRANAKILMDAFPELLLFRELKEGDCPLFVPVLVPDGRRDRLRRYLTEREIYCPIHWPLSEYHRPGEDEKRIYEQELSLVCDQRYTREDMERMVEVIREFWRESR